MLNETEALRSWLLLNIAFLGGKEEGCLCKRCGLVPLKTGEKKPKTLSTLELRPVTEDTSALWHSLLLQLACTYPYQESKIEIPAPLEALKFPCQAKHYSSLPKLCCFFLKSLPFFSLISSQQEFNRNDYLKLPLPFSWHSAETASS